MKNENIVLLEKGSSNEIQNDGFNINEIKEIEKWLKLRNVLQEIDNLLKFEDVKEWERSGGETYYTIFKVTYKRRKQQLEKNIVIKALVSLFPEKSLEDWKRRRLLLQNNNVPVSNWYYANKGTIIEDFYIKDVSKDSNIVLLLEIAKALDKMGFNPLGFIRDIRSNENGELFYLDFGFDLGEPTGKCNNQSINQLNAFLNND